jgi:hypothetical protein
MNTTNLAATGYCHDMETTQPIEIIASLEGMKITVTSDTCTLREYDFVANAWRDLESLPWPLTLFQAELWLDGWNRVDRFSALNRLIARTPE